MTSSARPDGLRALVIQNCEAEGIGLFAPALAARQVQADTFHAYRGGSFPALGDHDLIFIGGTPIGVRDLDRHAFARDEARFLERALAQGKPCVGICFGGQLLAHLLGAEVRRHRVPEIGGYRVTLTAAGLRDPWLDGFPDEFPVFQWHGDTFDVPAGADLLVEGDDCRNQCFRQRSALAVQFHLEVTAAQAASWADAYAGELEAIGKTRAQVIRECASCEGPMRQLADRLTANLVAGLT